MADEQQQIDQPEKRLSFFERASDWLFIQHPLMVLTFSMLAVTVYGFIEFRKESRQERLEYVKSTELMKDEFIRAVEKLQAEDHKMRMLEAQVHTSHRTEDRAFHREVFTKLERLLQQLIDKTDRKT